jgi:hypothetical protein
VSADKTDDSCGRSIAYSNTTSIVRLGSHNCPFEKLPNSKLSFFVRLLSLSQKTHGNGPVLEFGGADGRHIPRSGATVKGPLRAAACKVVRHVRDAFDLAFEASRRRIISLLLELRASSYYYHGRGLLKHGLDNSSFCSSKSIFVVVVVEPG